MGLTKTETVLLGLGVVAVLSAIGFGIWYSGKEPPDKSSKRGKSSKTTKKKSSRRRKREESSSSESGDSDRSESSSRERSSKKKTKRREGEGKKTQVEKFQDNPKPSQNPTKLDLQKILKPEVTPNLSPIRS